MGAQPDTSTSAPDVWHGIQQILAQIPVAAHLATYLAPGQVDLVERMAQPGEFLRVIMGPEMHEEQPRLVVEHVVVQRRDLDAVLAQGPQHRVHLLVTSLAVRTKSPVIAALPPPVGWKLMASPEPIATGTSMPLSWMFSARLMPTG